MLNLVAHTVLGGGGLGPRPSAAIEYVLSASGLYLRAEREHLSVMLPLAPAEVRGLPDVDPYVRFGPPTVPASHLRTMLERSTAAVDRDGNAIEVLFHLWWDEASREWRCEEPPQEATEQSVRATDEGRGSSFQRALIEVHSHHAFPAYFSPQDDVAERGFRIYGVIGDLPDHPAFRVRVGVHGYFWELPPHYFFSSPESVFPFVDTIAEIYQ